MPKMTYLTLWHVTMLTKFLVCISLCTYVRGAPTSSQEPSLLERINQSSCAVFPPPKINLPPKCSSLTLLSDVTKDLYSEGSVEYFLCAGLLDSTNRLCHLAKVNGMFGERVKSQFNDSLPNIMKFGDNAFCSETDVLDPKTNMTQAKFLYESLSPLSCATICFGLNKDIPIRAPMCKLILFAHHQIRAAQELQQKLNAQNSNSDTQKDGKGEKSDPQPPHLEQPVPIGQRIDAPAAQEKPETAQSAVSDGKPNAGTPTESQSAPQPHLPDANSVPSSTSRNAPPKAVPKIDQSGVQTGSEKSKSGADTQANTNLDEPAADHTKKSKAPQSSNNLLDGGDAQAKAGAGVQAQPGGLVQSGVETDPQGESPGDNPSQPAGDALGEGQVDEPFDTQAQDAAQDGSLREAQGNAQGNAPGDTPEDQGEDQNQPMTEDNDGINDSVRQDIEDDDMFDRQQQQPIKQELEKSTAGGKKSPEADIPLPVQQQMSQELTGQLATFEDAEDSHFFAYFMSLSALCVFAYLVYHNKRKIIAMAVEGKKGRNAGRRRPNSASYHKLDSNLEEAMSSNLASTNSYVIY